MFKNKKLKNKWKILILLKSVAIITNFYFGIGFKCDKKLIQGGQVYRCLIKTYFSSPDFSIQGCNTE